MKAKRDKNLKKSSEWLRTTVKKVNYDSTDMSETKRRDRQKKKKGKGRDNIKLKNRGEGDGGRGGGVILI